MVKVIFNTIRTALKVKNSLPWEQIISFKRPHFEKGRSD